MRNPATLAAFRKYRRPLAVVTLTRNTTDPSKPRMDDTSLTMIPGGVVILPWKPTQSLGTPEGERAVITFNGYAGVAITLTAQQKLKDTDNNSEYMVDRADRYGDHYELLLTKSK